MFLKKNKKHYIIKQKSRLWKTKSGRFYAVLKVSIRGLRGKCGQ